jgi:glycosyltransferase involved in cell wall biosynthesis
LKITLLQGAFLPVPPLRGGAIEKAWQALGEAFVRAGHEVTHISRLCDGLPRDEKIAGVDHRRIAGAEACSDSIRLKLREFSYVWRARQSLPPADILVTHAFWAPLLLPKEKYGEIYVHVGRYPKGQMKLYRRAARLQTPSQAVARAVSAELSDGDSRVRTVPYPLPFHVKDEPTPFNERPKRVLYAGRIHPEKGVLELVRAWAKLPESIHMEWTLRLIGPWREEQGGGGLAYKEEVRKSGGENVEIFEPVFEEEDLINEYQHARVFAYPSLASTGETFGLAVLEAMSCGCVPLVSPLECFNDFVVDGQNGFQIEANREEFLNALAESMHRLLGETELEALSNEAMKTASRYQIDQVASQYLHDFEELLRD